MMNPKDIAPADDDALAAATAALRATPTPAGPPAGVITRAERIPWSAPARGGRWFTPARFAVAAGVALLVGLACVYLLQHSATVAFADVAQAVARTRTFTAVMNADDPHPTRLLIKGDAVRHESDDAVSITDYSTGQTLSLKPSTHKATTGTTRSPRMDFYGLVRDYRPGNETALGERTVDGRKTLGFRLARPEAPELVWTFWVDPATRLPVRAEVSDLTLSDIKFDVPLDDALFATTVPAGYDATPTAADAWNSDRYAGHVTDERGKPVAGVRVTATCRWPDGGYSYMSQAVETDGNGRFEVESNGNARAGYPVRLDFAHPDLVYGRLEDVRMLPPEQRTDLRVRLRAGETLSGRVVDPAGQPVAGAMVQATVVKANDRASVEDYRKAVTSGPDGRFELRGMPGGKFDIQVSKTGDVWPPLTGRATASGATTRPLEVTARPVDLPPGKVVHELLGMKFVDLDDDLRKRLFLDPSDRVLIVDAGPNVKRFDIGDLRPGDSFWMVGNTRFRTFDEFARGLLAACEEQVRMGRASYSVRVVYNFSRVNRSGSNTQFMQLNENDLAELRKVVKR